MPTNLKVCLGLLTALASAGLFSCVAPGTSGVLPRAVHDEAPAAAVRIYTYCSNGRDLCRFEPPADWHVVFKQSDTDSDLEFSRISTDLLIVRERQHQAPGSVFLIRGSGQIVYRYDLHELMALREILGITPDGAVAFCNSGEGQSWCDGWWIGSSSRALELAAFPADCASPRFFPDGGAMCLQRLGHRLKIESVPGSNQFRDLDLPIQGSGPVDELIPWGRDAILITVLNVIYLWDGHELRELATPPIFGIKQFREKVFYLTCEDLATHPTHCQLWWVDRTFKPHRVQSLNTFPQNVDVLDDGTIVVETWRKGLRQIFRLGSTPEANTLLWSESGDAWREPGATAASP